MSTIKDKLKLARSAMQDIEKQFGRGAIMLLGGEDSRIEPVQTTPTGSVGLDLALGVGGLPRGRIVEIFGPEASGKTTLALHAIAAVQRQGGIAAFIDAEHALDPRTTRRPWESSSTSSSCRSPTAASRPWRSPRPSVQLRRHGSGGGRLGGGARAQGRAGGRDG
jgi:RecA/RadA recombinase